MFRRFSVLACLSDDAGNFLVTLISNSHAGAAAGVQAEFSWRRRICAAMLRGNAMPQRQLSHERVGTGDHVSVRLFAESDLGLVTCCAQLLRPAGRATAFPASRIYFAAANR
jgi:hypothetical protein